MKTNKKRTSKLKMKIAVVVGLLCCMAMGMSVMAFNYYYSYTIGTNQQLIANFTPGTSTIYLNTRPSTGGNVTIYLKGAANTSAVFPYYTSRADWKVTGVFASGTLTVEGKADSGRTSGTLHIWS